MLASRSSWLQHKSDNDRLPRRFHRLAMTRKNQSVFISWRTVKALRKCAGGTFLALNIPAMPGYDHGNHGHLYQKSPPESEGFCNTNYLLLNCFGVRKSVRWTDFSQNSEVERAVRSFAAVKNRNGLPDGSPFWFFISWRTAVRGELPSNRTSFFPSFWGHGSGSLRPSELHGTRG